MRNSKTKSGSRIATEIRGELRSIVGQYRHLRTPLHRFETDLNRPSDAPQHYVMFSMSRRRKIQGVRTRVPYLELPDEKICDAVFQFAESVWHLKDRLRRYGKATGRPVNVERLASESRALLVCADLANLKKHGANENRSGLNPRLGLVRFDTSKSGTVEFWYNGAAKQKELIVSNRTPISFNVNIVTNEGSVPVGDAVTIIHDAFGEWLAVIHELGLLEGADRETVYLKNQLKALFPGMPNRST